MNSELKPKESKPETIFPNLQKEAWKPETPTPPGSSPTQPPPAPQTQSAQSIVSFVIGLLFLLWATAQGYGWYVFACLAFFGVLALLAGGTKGGPRKLM